jgi:glycosyltransferase involved in cell wall biosynthesis
LINYVCNLPKQLRTGGFSGINAAAVAAIEKFEPICYVGPINPPFVRWQKALSKLLRVAGLPGAFSFFSERRLATIAAEVHSRCAPEARLDLFYGFTPWIRSRTPRPYLAYSDCTFRDYMNIYHRREQFDAQDLERIERAEADWLRNARLVLFTSAWAAGRAISDYGLVKERVAVVGQYCDIELPARDVYQGSRQFAFVSTNFAAKGGPVVLSAFREVKRRHPEATLVVVGDQPTTVGDEPGVTFAGFLHKERPPENARLREIFAQSRALVHPTHGDIAPLVIAEAGYFGCPVIASRKFAIPELIDHQRSGLLLDDPSQPVQVVDAMIAVLEDEDAYQGMRRAAWEKARREYSREPYEERIVALIQEGRPPRRQM